MRTYATHAMQHRVAIVGARGRPASKEYGEVASAAAGGEGV
jgi:hypothetical protein